MFLFVVILINIYITTIYLMKCYICQYRFKNDVNLI